jgi:hypothetical protein
MFYLFKDNLIYENILSKSQNNNEQSVLKELNILKNSILENIKYTNIKSAENIKGFSETICQSNNLEKKKIVL